ncbi:MAG: HD domain-containing protein [Dehalococcoidia bacterium]|nr:HD domain-containing protein [Dehalococcoidia bacterium]
MRERVRQFRHAGRKPTPADYALARQYLSPELFDLFAAQHPRDVVHSAATARWLIERGHTDPDLVAAGLLHDVGKGYQRRADRVVYVLACHAGLVQRLAGERSRFALRRAVYRSLTHSASGGDTLARAGASPRVVELTQLHHGPSGGDTVLALLQEADAAS